MEDIRIACFDIGRVNFAFYVEDCSASLMKNLSKYYASLPKKVQRVNSQLDERTAGILRKIVADGKRVPNGMNVFDIREDKSAKKLDTPTRVNLHKLLESYEWLWDTCDMIVIEQQYVNFRGKKKKMEPGSDSQGANTDAIKLGESCFTWFLQKYYPFKEITYFGSSYKTQVFGATKMNKAQRKKWAKEKGRSIFEEKKDQEAIDFLENKKNAKGRKQKLDDVYDCLLMAQAYKYKKLISDI